MSSAIAPIRTAGIATGLALAALMVLAFRVPASGQSLGAGVRMTAVAPGEVHVPRTGAFLKAGGLEPGGKSVRATLPVTNVTRGPVDVRLRARMGNHDLDRAVHVQLRAGGRTLASTTLAGLRDWTQLSAAEQGRGARRPRARLDPGGHRATRPAAGWPWTSSSTLSSPRCRGDDRSCHTAPQPPEGSADRTRDAGAACAAVAAALRRHDGRRLRDRHRARARGPAGLPCAPAGGPLGQHGADSRHRRRERGAHDRAARRSPRGRRDLPRSRRRRSPDHAPRARDARRGSVRRLSHPRRRQHRVGALAGLLRPRRSAAWSTGSRSWAGR